MAAEHARYNILLEEYQTMYKENVEFKEKSEIENQHVIKIMENEFEHKLAVEIQRSDK